jgi:hypothetical protein
MSQGDAETPKSGVGYGISKEFREILELILASESRTRAATGKCDLKVLGKSPAPSAAE